MASRPLSVGDILMLSQTAWKIGRAFAQGLKKTALFEFAEVERHANGLSQALKLVAETLHTDGSSLSQADGGTRSAVNTIMESAGKTLSDLESFVERYHIIKKKETSGGFVVERSWSDVILANYKTLKWTTEGGDITELRNMLQTHTNTINLTMQALQSRSLTRLEKTVVPMAEHIADIHGAVPADLGDKIDDLHWIIVANINSTPSLQARDWAINDANSIRNSSSTLPALDTFPRANGSDTRILVAPTLPRALSIRQYHRRESPKSSASFKATRPGREDSAYYSMDPLPSERDGRTVDWGFESGSPPDHRGSIGDDYPAGFSTGSPEGELRIARRECTPLPSLFKAIDETEAFDAVEGSSRDPYCSEVSPTARVYASSSKANPVRSSIGQPILPPPAIPSNTSDAPRSPATPSSYFGSPQRLRSGSGNVKEVSRPNTAKSVRQSKAEKPNSPGSPSMIEDPAFEKSLFRNAAILCDVRGILLEFAQSIPDEPDPRFNTEMVEACKAARVCVIRKRENREHGGTLVATSIWTLSDDGAVRIQQRLSDYNETVPYGSYFDPNKVSLAPSEGEIELKWHAEKWGDVPKESKHTNWVNHCFFSENDAVAFQSAVFGRTLVGSFRTTKTTVIHEGFTSAFAFEEQFANIEMLRLWEDDGISMPGAAGGVMALMHISSNFGEGWARWWINSSKQQFRVKEDSSKGAKVKGIDILVVKPGGGALIADRMGTQATAGEGLKRVVTNPEFAARPQGGRRKPVEKVTGVRIEFKTEDERRRFIRQCYIVRQRMIPLPDL